MVMNGEMVITLWDSSGILYGGVRDHNAIDSFQIKIDCFWISAFFFCVYAKPFTDSMKKKIVQQTIFFASSFLLD
jgi:hypothetical protein